MKNKKNKKTAKPMKEFVDPCDRWWQARSTDQKVFARKIGELVEGVEEEKLLQIEVTGRSLRVGWVVRRKDQSGMASSFRAQDWRAHGRAPSMETWFSRLVEADPGVAAELREAVLSYPSRN